MGISVTGFYGTEMTLSTTLPSVLRKEKNTKVYALQLNFKTRHSIQNNTTVMKTPMKDPHKWLLLLHI